MTILEEIIAHKLQETERSRSEKPVQFLERSRLFKRATVSLAGSVTDPAKTGIIAEFKRKSPSKGVINDRATLEEVVTGYFRSGASGISILTDLEYFGGTMHDLMRARELTPVPILRKDFVVDEYQIIESKAIGADAVLLIAAALDPGRVKKLAGLAATLGLQVLLEVHREEELECMNEHVTMVGVNNRDLNTFVVDTEVSVRLAEKIPPGFIKISESGINTTWAIKQLKGCGYQGFLMGESFMRAPEPAVAFSDFVKLMLFEND
jgi:indole-3-glycerol phosphate synthase